MGLSFTSPEFLIFLVVCLALMSRMRGVSAQSWLLIIVSCLFYLSFGVAGVIVLALTAFADFQVGRRLAVAPTPEARKRLLLIGIAVNIGPLALFKYSGFLADSLASLLHPFGVRVWVSVDPLLGIVGLSYFSFSGMSYILDIYYEIIEPTQSISQFVCYLLYFPKLVAGPIVRAGELLPQFNRGARFTADDFETGCAYLLVGAVKKLLIADRLAGHVGMILAAPQHYNALTLVQGMIGYTIEIYADFSGYSDMAIGCARLMGIRFPQNFLMPYSSINIAEFWRRWHVTMSRWFRDYLFLPLEIGSRRTRNANVRVARNMIITMLVCGLWHGASWNFVVWGGLHGIALSAYLIYATNRRRQSRGQTQSAFHPATLAARALTLSTVMVGWIIFGTASLTVAFQYLLRLFTWATDGVSLGSPYILPLAALVFVVHFVIAKDRNVIEELPTLSVRARVFAYASLMLALTALVQTEAVPFVYVHF